MDKGAGKKRTTAFQRAMEDSRIDISILMGLAGEDPNIAYLSGTKTDFTFFIIPKKGNPVLAVPKMEFEKAKKESWIRDIRKLEKPAFEFVSGIAAEKAGRARKAGTTTGINRSVATLNDFSLIRKSLKKKIKNISFPDVGQMLAKQRSIKDDEEIGRIRKACCLTDRLFAAVVEGIRSGRLRKESDVKRAMEEFAYKSSCTLAFEPIIASGKSSSIPHYRSGRGRLKKGFCVLDFGIRYKGYCSDMTRTIYLGKPTEKETEYYSRLKMVQEETIKMASAGMGCSELYECAAQKLGELKELFTHGLGHGFGIFIHELPSLSPGESSKLEDGMVFTIEPGIYDYGKFGIRIEDDILLHNGRRHVLTRSTKDLIIIDGGRIGAACGQKKA